MPQPQNATETSPAPSWGLGSRALVVKFGGASLATPERLRRGARRVAGLVREGRRLVVVVSAMGETTDAILRKAGVAGARIAGRELDRALATGENLSASLFAAVLQTLGVDAKSLTGPEAGVHADGAWGAASIVRVDPSPLRALLESGVVAVVAGFQAARPDGEVTTLGRGGSDTSAVAIAAALGPVPCALVKDVDRVYDRDPDTDPRAVPFDRLTHAQLRRLAEAGARVFHPEAARLAERHRVPLRFLAYRSESLDSGTLVVPPQEAA